MEDILFLKGDFNYIAQGEELVVEPFQKLIDRKQLIAYKLWWLLGLYGYFQRAAAIDDMYTQGSQEKYGKPLI